MSLSGAERPAADRGRDLSGRRDAYRLVAAIDRSEYAEIVLEHALDQASRFAQLDLHVLTVEEDHRRRGRGRRAETYREPDLALKSWLQALVSDALETFGHGRPAEGRDWHVRLHVRIGDAADEIAGLGSETQADLVVIGRFGLHQGRHGGSVADQVLRQVDCPLLVVGLTQHVPDSIEGCEECVATRRDSSGERWFCDAHSDNAGASLGMASVLLPSGDLGLGGPVMW